MSEPVPNRELTGLEAALKALAPAAAALDRDRLFFRAGQAAARKPGWVWPAAAAVLALTTGTLALLHALGPTRRPVVRVVRVVLPVPVLPPHDQPAPPPTAPDEPDLLPREEQLAGGSLPEGYIRQRNQVLRWGVDALPGPPPIAGPTRGFGPTHIYNFADWLPGRSSLKIGGSL